MSKTTFTFRVDETLKSEFSAAAKHCDRNAAQLLRDFMRDFVRQQQEAAAHDAWFRRQVQIGLDSADAGNLVSANRSRSEVCGQAGRNAPSARNLGRMMKLFWTPEAIRDRDEIYDYIEADNPAAALALDELFAEKAGRLVDHPGLGRPGRIKGTRELVVHTNYILIYDVAGDAVRILRVLHAARQWPPRYKNDRFR